MPGNTVKNWRQYEALRAEGMSKEKAARITNASVAKRRRKRKRAIYERLRKK